MEYTLQEAAQMLGCAPVTVGRLVRRGRLDASQEPGYRRPVLVDGAALRTLKAERRRMLAHSWSTAEAAARLGCSQRTVQRLVQLGLLDRYPHGGPVLRVRRASVNRYTRTRIMGDELAVAA